MWLMLGIAIGVLLTIPVAVVAARRTARRVRRLEQRARSAERLAELGTLTGGLAHEIKNPLSTIGLNVQLVRENLRDLAQHVNVEQDPTAQSHFAKIQRRFDALTKESQRLQQILEDFLSFAGRIQLEREPTDLNGLVDELAAFFEPQAAAFGVRLRTQLDAAPAVVRADTGLLKQALLNLMLNACQAMGASRDDGRPSGGADELMLRTDRRREHGAQVVQVHVTDTGPGMDTDTAQRVFQPYYSRRKGGTGLGLPTARRIIEEHGGTLSLHTEPGRGSAFTIALPADDEEPPADEKPGA